jgi:hypothetical protein
MKRHSVTDVLPRELASAWISDLYRDHAPEILGYALRRSGDPDDAADVVAEAFLIAWRRLGEVPPGDETRLWLSGRPATSSPTKIAARAAVTVSPSGCGTSSADSFQLAWPSPPRL